MTCETVRLPGGGAAIVCGPRRRTRKCQVAGCDRPGERQCDFPVADGKTCDRYICTSHAASGGGDRDYCPSHPPREEVAAETLPALTIWQPWASLIVIGAKPYEFRGWVPPVSKVGRRIAIHAGVREVRAKEVRALLIKLHGERWAETGLIRDIAIPFLERVRAFVDRPPHVYKGVVCQRCGEIGHPRSKRAAGCLAPDAARLPTSSVLGTAVLGTATLNPIVDGRRLVEDSDRSDHLNYGWPLTEIERFDIPVPARGFQGFWWWERGHG